MKNKREKQAAVPVKTVDIPLTAKDLHAAPEKQIQRKIWRGLFLTSICITIFVELVLCGIEAYIKNDVTLYVWDLILSYFCDILAPVNFFASCGFVGYSVMRYGVAGYRAPVWFMGISVTITQLCRVGLSYLMMTSREREIFLSAWLPFAFANYILVLLEVLCIFVVCSVIRNAVYSSNRRELQAKQKKRKSRFGIKKTPLRKVYFSLLLLISFFSLIPAVYTAVIDYIDLGFFQNFSELYTFVKPFLQIIIYGAVGYFLMLLIGKRLCRYQNNLRKEDERTALQK